MSTPIEIYDVTSYPGFIFTGTDPTEGLTAISYDSTDGLLFLGARDFVGPTSPNHSHFEVWRVDPITGAVTLLQTIQYNLPPTTNPGFAGPIGMYYQSGYLYVNSGLGLESYTVDLSTGNLSRVAYTEVAEGGFQRLVRGCVVNRTGQNYLIGGNGTGGNQMWVFPLPPGEPAGTPVMFDYDIGDSWCSKLNDTFFYACSNDGTLVYRFSIDDSGNVTQLESYATGLSSNPDDTPPKISSIVWNGNVYVGGEPTTGANAYFPIVGTNGELGTRVDGAVDFTNNFQYQLNGVSATVQSGQQYIPVATGAFYVIDVDTGSNQWLWYQSYISGIVPSVVGDDLGSAANTLNTASYVVGAISGEIALNVPIGQVISQDPPGGSSATPESPVNLVLSVPDTNFEAIATVISQYQNSPVLLQLVENMSTYINQQVNYASFYAYVWNVYTAVGFGLDIWGSIVGVSRLLNVGGTTVSLDDDDYRTLVLVKALSNITATTAPALNQLLTNLFGDAGRVYVTDPGGMQMNIVFEFTLTPTQYAILTESGAVPHPAGVQVNIVDINPSGTFGFNGSGLQPFNQGTFWA